ncbi:hypothetical protein SZ64_05105 [Erythrobacter sp. SG61-1L]|uniref:hypothetical protein n=1 Tax=Erythrobacter sp. SG61-1L TaxID=1603897 RepID=UPI0006C92412|nr:hypothetical protein [Erythrobacter sp. SG61-1L]KPL67540.1 hypothetical protein SZ64_05105 [Erythrobacter sp. SG61-1L]
MAAVASATSANAQTAGQAFECALPYQATMNAAGKLEVLRQSSSPGMALLSGPSNTVEFAVGETKVFGAVPTSLTFKLQEPRQNAPRKTYTATVNAYFPDDAATDQAIIAANSWHLGLCGPGLSLCIRAKDAAPDGAGELRYHRQKGTPFWLECVFEFSEEEIKALG